MKLTKKKISAWEKWKRKWMSFENGFNNYANDKIFKYFNIDPNWANLPDGQAHLEGMRTFQHEVPEFESKRFAQIYTRKFSLYKFKNTEKIAMEDYVQKDFFDSVLLYGCLRIIYSFIENDNDFVTQADLSEHLDNHLQYALEQYFKRKKKNKKIWEKLDRYEQKRILDQITFTLINNFKSTKFKVLKNVQRAVFEKGEYHMKTFIGAHPEFNKSILGDYPWVVRDLPCIAIPKEWQLNQDNSVTDGGYQTYKLNFLNTKYTFVGEAYPTQKLINNINKLQETPWTLDPLAYNPYFISIEFKEILKYLETNKKQIERSEDILQTLNTLLFLMKFCPNFTKFYYIWVIDMRGRLYSASDWGFSPTSSKYVRKAIRLANSVNLTEEGINWLYLKIGRLQNIEAKSNLELLNKVKALNIKLDDYKILQDFPDYNTYYIVKLYNDIEAGLSDEIPDMDATNSAYQFIAIVTRSEKLAYLTNLTGENSEIVGPDSPFEKQDLYTYVMKKCKEKLPHDSMALLLNRSLMKSLVMPLSYGKTQESSGDDIRLYIRKTAELKNAVLNIPDDIIIQTIKKKDFNFPDRNTDAYYYENQKIFYYSLWFYSYFKEILEYEFPELVTLDKVFKGAKAPLKNFIFQSPFLTFKNCYNKFDTYQLIKNKDNQENKMTFPYVTDEPDSRKESQAAIANFIHCLDAYAAHLIIDKMIQNNIKIYTIHDNFKVNPNHISFLQETVNEAYNEIQNYLKTIPELAIFHSKEPLKIVSKNLLKID